MVDDRYEAAADANAQALLHVLEGQHPAETEFEHVLTLEQEHKHYYFNDDILLIAERIDDIVRTEDARRTSLISQYGYPDDTDLQPHNATAATSPDRRAMSGQGWSRWEQFRRDQETWQQEIVEFEQQIEQILNEVRTEYRRLAEVLTSGREEYVESHEVVRQRIEVEIPEATEVMREAYGELPEDFRAYVVPTNELYDARNRIYSYERNFADYRMLQEGLSITIDDITVYDVVWWAALFIIGEIITLGTLHYFVLGARAVSLTRAGRAVTASAQRMMKRFNDLADRTKDILANIRRRRRGEEPLEASSTGPQGQSTTVRATVRNCACTR